MLYYIGVGLVQQPAVRQRAGTCRSKQRADVQSKAVTAVPVRRSQRQLQQRQVREQQQQDKIQHNVTVNAQVSDTIALLASPVPSTERPSAECAASPGVDGDFVAVLRQTNQGSCYRPSAHQQASEQEQHQQQLQVQQQCVKPSKPVCAMTGTSSKGKVHSPTGVKKQVSPISKGVSKGLGLGARFPLRVRKNLDQLQAKQVSNNEQGYVQLNRGLADVARSVGC